MERERSCHSRARERQCARRWERTRGARLTCLTIAVLFSITCRDELITNVTDTEDVVATGLVSDPTPAVATAGSLALASEVEQLVFVSLPPDSFPEGRRAVISNARTGSTVTTSMVDGGLDPVSLPALVDDVVVLEVLSGTGGSLAQLSLVVPKDNKPRVLRVSPAHKKRDVPLNIRLVIIFSEPIDGTTLTPASIQLLRGSTRVAGTAQFLHPSLDPNHVSVEFVPTAPLAPETDYQLVVTTAVRDLDGVALAAFDPVSFTTGTSLTGPPASISLSADTLKLVVGSTHQLTAIVRDAAGNTLTDQPITWSLRSPGVVTVSATGLVTAVGDGRADVTATAGNASRFVIVEVKPRPAASVTIAPAAVAAGDTIFVTATLRDAEGVVINFAPMTWTSSDPAVAIAFGASTVGRVIGVREGTATITATSIASGTATVTVGLPVPVASVTVDPSDTTVLAQWYVGLTVTLRDATGRKIAGRPITWTSDNEAVATVGGEQYALVTGVSEGSAVVTATSGGFSDAATIAVTVVEFASVSVGAFTCGLTASGAAYCWPAVERGSHVTAPVVVPGGLTFSALTAGSHACGLTTTGAAYCWRDNLSTEAVPGGLTFTALSARDGHICGLAANGSAYCWNAFGSDPTLVSSELTFSAIAAGANHACGVTTTGAAHCWGFNAAGQLGDGSTNSSSMPLAVAGGLTFTSLTAGSDHTCGVTTSGDAYCWGDNARGQLGNGSRDASSIPVGVSRGRRFTALSAGHDTCGLTTRGEAYCWGDNSVGQLGDGSTNGSEVPVAVAGGLTFTAVSVGEEHVCGFGINGTVYCWGSNRDGKLGLGVWKSDGPEYCAGADLIPCSTVPKKVGSQR